MTIFLHAGTHKTGSKSFQELIAENAAEIRSLGYDVFTGSHRNPRNHTELHLASQRLDRDSLAKHNWPDLTLGEDYQRKVAGEVQSFLNHSASPHQLFSNEDLSFLRYPDEFARLRRLFGDGAQDFVVVIVLRNRDDFLQSYTKQIYKKPGRVPLKDRSSALYVEPDTWLLDYDALVNGFRSHFGAEVRIINYDDASAHPGGVPPTILSAIGIDPALLPVVDYRLNVTANSAR